MSKPRKKYFVYCEAEEGGMGTWQFTTPLSAALAAVEELTGEKT